jgi:hypothetical protein
MQFTGEQPDTWRMRSTYLIAVQLAFLIRLGVLLALWLLLRGTPFASAIASSPLVLFVAGLYATGELLSLYGALLVVRRSRTRLLDRPSGVSSRRIN